MSRPGILGGETVPAGRPFRLSALSVDGCRSIDVAGNTQMPVDIDDAASKAKFDNGVLQLTLPKKVAVAGQRLNIE